MKIVCKNKKARFEYEIIKKYEVGIVLTGNEIKSIRQGHIHLNDCFCKINYENEIFIHNMHITNYNKSHSISKLDEKRTRKLLLNKGEIKKINQELKQKGFTIVPLCVYLKGNLCKLEIAVARGKKLHDKRQSIKERDIKREMDKAIKNR